MFNVVLDFGQDFLWNSGYFSSILSWNDVQWFGGDLGFISLCEVVYTAPLGQLANSPVVARKGAAEEMAGPDHYWHWLQTWMVLTYLWQSESHSWDHFLYLARSKLRLCSANHGQVTEVTWPVIGRAQSELIPSKKQENEPWCMQYSRGLWQTVVTPVH